MTLYVKIENDQVTQVWDTLPPADERGWREAIEVNVPAYGRQGKHGHHFDLTKTPVEIVYDTFDISVEDRRASLVYNANTRVEQLRFTSERHPEMVDAARVQAAEARRDLVLAALAEAEDHGRLDQIEMDVEQNPI